MDSIVIGILVAVLAWLFMRHKRASASRRQQARAPAPAETPRTMPRIGTQGTVTKDQLRRLKEFHFESLHTWSREEADLILDSVVYLRAAILQARGDRDAPEDIQNSILAFILSDDKLRAYMMSWGENRRNKGYSEAGGSLARNEHYERVAALVRDLYARERDARLQALERPR